MVKKTNKITNGIKISFYIPYDWHEQMRDIADKSGSPISVHYRMAIKEYIDKRIALTHS